VVWPLNFFVSRTCGTHAWPVDGGLGGCGMNNKHV
jgi:hypothetical protein